MFGVLHKNEFLTKSLLGQVAYFSSQWFPPALPTPQPFLILFPPSILFRNFFSQVDKRLKTRFSVAGMNVEERVKRQIEQAQTTGGCLKLTQVAQLVDVPYDRIYRLMTQDNYRLSAIDGEKIEKSLPPVTDV